MAIEHLNLKQRLKRILLIFFPTRRASRMHFSEDFDGEVVRRVAREMKRCKQGIDAMWITES
jgi:hypothetical protein